MEAPEIELVAHLQRGEEVLLHGGGVLVVLDLPDAALDPLRPHLGVREAALRRVKGLGPNGEEGGVERQGLMDLIPGDAEGHHHVGHGVGLGEEITDLGKGVDVPGGHVVGLHGLHPALVKAALLHLALADLFHDLEGHLGVQAFGDEIEHDVVPAAHRLQNAGRAPHDQLPGVAQPHVRPVGEAGKPYQSVEVLGLGVHQHLAGEAGVELRNGHGAGGAQHLVVLIAQHLAGDEDGHGVRVVQGDGLGVHAGEVLHHAHHSRVIMAQHVQLEDVGLHAVVFKMGGDGVRVVGVRRVLDGAEILHILVVRHHHQSSGVLARGAAHAHTPQGQPLFLSAAHLQPVLLQILENEAEGGLVRQGADGAGPEHLGLAEHLDGVAVGPGLVLAGEVQVDVRNLAAAEAQKGLKGDVKAVLHIGGAADGAHLVRHVGPAAVGPVQHEFAVLALWAAVVGRQGVDLRDAGHVGNEGGAHASPGAHQVPVFQGALNQLLSRHVHHVVLAQDAAQLHVQPVHDELGRVLAVEPVDLFPHQVVELLLRVFQSRRKQLRRQQLEGLHLVGDEAGVGHHHLIGLLLPQVGEFPQHLVRRLEVDGQRRVGVREFLRRQQDVAIRLVLRLPEMNVPRGADGLAQFLSQPDDDPVELPQILLRAHVAVSQHEGVVAKGLDLQVVVEGGDALELLPILVVRHRPKQLSRLAGGADNDALTVLHQQALGDGGHPLEVFQVGG